MKHTRRKFIGISMALAAARPLAVHAQTPTIVTLLGNGTPGTATHGGSVADAQINDPYGITEDPARTGLFFVDNRTHRVLALDYATMTVRVIAGTGTAGYSGDDGPARDAQLAQPHELRFDSKGNLYIADRDNHVIRRIDMNTGVISTFAGTAGTRGFSGDGDLASRAQFNQPHGIVFDAADNLYVCDLLNHRVRRIDAVTGVIDTFAGNGMTGRSPDEGALLQTAIEGPRALECTRTGNVYVALREGNSVFHLDGASGRMQRIAGNGSNGYTGDGGQAVNATFGAAAPGGLTGPKGLCASEDGNTLFVADCENHVIRRVDLMSGIITTVAGTGTAGNGADGDPLICELNRPHAVHHRGDTLYITDSSNHRIRMLSPA
jgi:DNA-binding beta-propeller fold protein YncE